MVNEDKQSELFSRLWRLHFKFEAFYAQMPTPELKQAVERLCTTIEYAYCSYSPSIAEDSLKTEIDSWSQH